MKLKNTRRGFTRGCFPKGFTLIELLVVVLIIGILAAVAVPQYKKAVLKSRLAQWDVMYDAGRKAIDAYLLENGWLASGTVRFTGKNRVGTIEMPGNCDIDNTYCYTSAGGVNVYCESSSCVLIVAGFAKADGTMENKVLGDDTPGIMSSCDKAGGWRIDFPLGKAGCLWTSTHPDIPVSSSGITSCKNTYGVTLPNPEYRY